MVHRLAVCVAKKEAERFSFCLPLTVAFSQLWATTSVSVWVVQSLVFVGLASPHDRPRHKWVAPKRAPQPCGCMLLLGRGLPFVSSSSPLVSSPWFHPLGAPLLIWFLGCSSATTGHCDLGGESCTMGCSCALTSSDLAEQAGVGQLPVRRLFSER